jgi:hypothetical protein
MMIIFEAKVQDTKGRRQSNMHNLLLLHTNKNVPVFINGVLVIKKDTLHPTPIDREQK